jgi:methionine synthase / methylenetetrahydrofolate reductase(NADPH)
MRIHDGAYGTLLASHLHGDETVDDLCLRAPGLVVDAHRAYLDVGARAIQTNSFLAHLRGSSRRRRQLRHAALECAREAAAGAPGGSEVLVLATIGPVADRASEFW